MVRISITKVVQRKRTHWIWTYPLPDPKWDDRNDFLIRILIRTKERTRGDVPNEGAVPWRRAGGEGRWPALVRGGSSRRRACFRRSCSRPARSDSCRSPRTTSLPSPMGGPGCSGGGPTDTWPACRMPAGGYEDALFELKAPSSLHGLAEKVLLEPRDFQKLHGTCVVFSFIHFFSKLVTQHSPC